MELQKQRIGLIFENQTRSKLQKYFLVIEAERQGAYICEEIPITEKQFHNFKQFYHIHYSRVMRNAQDPTHETTIFETWENATQDMENPRAEEAYRFGKLPRINSYEELI
jgi:hypothetical protein